MDKDLDESWAWWQPIVGIILIIVLGRLLRMWLPDIAFGATLLIVIPIVVVVRVALLVRQQKPSDRARERKHDTSPESRES